MADDQQSFRRKDQERMADGALFQSLEPGELGRRRELVAWDERAAGDGIPERAGRLLPVHPPVGRVGSQVGDVAVLGERLAGAREVAALPQARVEVIQQRTADLAYFLDPECGLDGAADIAEVGLHRGHVPPGHRNVLVEQSGDGDVRVRLPPCPCEREQLAELDLRLDLGPAGLPEPELAAGQRVLPGVYPGTPRPARQLLYVTGRLTRQATQPQSRRSTNGSQIDRRSYQNRRWG
jgi:hypothetical protein